MAYRASPILQNLWQGPKPEPYSGEELKNLGFQVLVLCAEEWQPPPSVYDGLDIIYAPNNDNPEITTTSIQEERARIAGRSVAKAILNGKKVLVTCQMGLNRSGFVSAFAIHYLTGKSGFHCISLVQRRRPNSLYNTNFVDILSKLPDTSKSEYPPPATLKSSPENGIII